MSNNSRIKLIEERLTANFNPTRLEVIDESHKHIGHEGAKSGLGHFKVCIAANAFSEKSEIQIHRMIYATLGDLMKTDIHALSIEIIN
jgi:BolA protein